MSELRIYSEQGNTAEAIINDPGQIRERLAAIDIIFEQWATDAALAVDADAGAVEAAYADDIERLKKHYAFESMDILAVQPDHPERETLRDKFLHEHTHDDFEVRFFVDGQGLFYLRSGGKVYGLLCTAGDLISVPAGTLHWFDMGSAPCFKVIRFFVSPDGWVGHFTGDDIAERYPPLDAVAA